MPPVTQGRTEWPLHSHPLSCLTLKHAPISILAVVDTDKKLFRIGEKEAQFMQPVQCWVLEAVFRAVEHAGLKLEQLQGTRWVLRSGICRGTIHTPCGKKGRAPLFRCNYHS